MHVLCFSPSVEPTIFSQTQLDAGGRTGLNLCIEITMPDANEGNCGMLAGQLPNQGFSTTSCVDSIVDECPQQAQEAVLSNLASLSNVCPTAIVTVKCELPSPTYSPTFTPSLIPTQTPSLRYYFDMK